MKKFLITTLIMLSALSCYARKEYIDVYISIKEGGTYVVNGFVCSKIYTTEGYINKSTNEKIKVKDDNGESVKFRSLVEIFNYYANLGYELVPIDLNKYDERYSSPKKIDNEIIESFYVIMCKDL